MQHLWHFSLHQAESPGNDDRSNGALNAGKCEGWCAARAAAGSRSFSSFLEDHLFVPDHTTNAVLLENVRDQPARLLVVMPHAVQYAAAVPELPRTIFMEELQA